MMTLNELKSSEIKQYRLGHDPGKAIEMYLEWGTGWAGDDLSGIRQRRSTVLFD
jgi:hypothetical protein